MKRIVISSLLLTTLALVTSPATANSKLGTPSTKSQASAIVDIINTYRDHHVIDGVVLVRKGDEVLFHDYVATVRQQADTLTVTTPLPIASLTKPLTATLIMMLAQQGKLHPDDTLDKYLPAFNPSVAKHITLAHLLSHRSGLPNHFEIEGWFNPAFHQSVSDEQFTEIIASLPLRFTPGRDYLYSNPGYFLLGKVIEKVTGMPLQIAFNTLLFKRASMTHSGFVFAAQSAPVDAFKWQKGGGVQPVNSGDMRLFGAGAALATTAGDLDNFLRTLFSGNTLLTADSKASMLNQDKPYSWRVKTVDTGEGEGQSLTLINYDGKYEGYSSYLLHIPEQQISVILLSRNGTSYALKQQLAGDISTVLLGLPVPKQQNDPVLLLVKALAEGKVAQQLKQIQHQGFDLNPMSDLAFEILWSGLADEALATFTMIQQQYPDADEATRNLQFACQHRLTQNTPSRGEYCGG